MEYIGIICEYNPFHNGHIYHIEKIKEMYPNSIIILVLNGYFLERGEISILTKENKTKIALEFGIDLVLELPVLYGTQSADIFAKKAISILNEFKVNIIIFGSVLNDINILNNIVDEINNNDYQNKVKELLNKGMNYPTALAKAINTKIDFNNPNDLLGISYLKVIKNKNYTISPITIKRTSDYHNLDSKEKIISASNIRNKYKNQEDITNYLPTISRKLLVTFNEELFFNILKIKILTTPHLEKFLTVDEGIENRLKENIKKCSSLEDFIKLIKTKRYTYNKLNRMFIHIMLGITKKENINTLSYIKILGFNKNGQEYLNKIKNHINISTKIDKTSIQYKTEIKASILYDILTKSNTYEFELENKPIKKL